MQSRRSSTVGKWSGAKSLDDLNSNDADHRSPFLLPEGRFYLAANKVPDEKLKDLKNYDLFERVGGRAPTPLLKVCTADDELFPWVPPGGKEFFFSRKTKAGWRLFVSRGPAFGAIGEGKLIEELPVGFHHATLTSNGLSMYLQGPLEKGRWGLFRTSRNKVGAKWADPEPLATLNNPESEQGDMSPCLAQGGSILYFVSDRPGGQGGLDIWWIATAKLKVKTK
jgi:hypothetical protein